MIFKIKTPEQAESILRSCIGSDGDIVFDISPECDASQVPLIIRECDRGCKGDGDSYIGPNIWGRGFQKSSTYCGMCGYAFRSKVEVSIAIQGAVLLETNYRSENTDRSPVR